MTKTLLDLGCSEGGGAMGYHRAGFRVVGVDLKPQPRYPFEMIVRDYLTLPVSFLRLFDAVHASPPCQAYSTLRAMRGLVYPDLVGPTRDLLDEAGVPYVIENVPGAPIRKDVTLCGSMFGMEIRRHRHFELGGWWTMQHGCTGHDRPIVSVVGHAESQPPAGSRRSPQPRNADHARYLMGMPWATMHGCTQAIPPAYTEHIGAQLLAFV